MLCHFPLLLPLLEVQNILWPILGHEIVIRKATPLRHRELMASREVLLERGVLDFDTYSAVGLLALQRFQPTFCQIFKAVK